MPSGAIIFSPSVKALPATWSNTMSAPRPWVSASTRSTASSLDVSIACAAPRERAKAHFSAEPAVPITVAPADRATSISAVPTPPAAPYTTTVLGVTPRAA